MVLFWVLSIIRHLVFRGPKKGTIILIFGIWNQKVGDSSDPSRTRKRAPNLVCTWAITESPYGCFPKFGARFGSPHKDHSILGSVLGPRDFGNPHIDSGV